LGFREFHAPTWDNPTAIKTGKERDGTAVLYVAYTKWPEPHVVLLDYDIIQIEGALLENWLPGVIDNAKQWARTCRARSGSIGAFIEDKGSGMILLQQAARRSLPARALPEALTMLGKDERAINASGYVYRGQIKFGRKCILRDKRAQEKTP
jgi:hypothetical protein